MGEFFRSFFLTVVPLAASTGEDMARRERVWMKMTRVMQRLVGEENGLIILIKTEGINKDDMDDGA